MMKRALAALVCAACLFAGCLAHAAGSEADALLALGFITPDELSAGPQITVREGLLILHRMSVGKLDNPGSLQLEWWYSYPELTPQDDLPDELKVMLIDLLSESVLSADEIANLQPDAELTRYQALVYVTRQLGDTSCCILEKAESSFTTREQTRDMAISKGLMDDGDAAISDELIGRDAYYRLIQRALYAKIQRGGHAAVRDFCYIDELQRRAASAREQAARTPMPVAAPAPGTNPVLHEDLSVSWRSPEGDEPIGGYSLVLIRDDGAEEAWLSGISLNSLSREQVLEALLRVYPAKLSALRLRYRAYAQDYTSAESESMDIDLSGIDVRVEGSPLVPGTLSESADKNDFGTTLTLDASTPFIAGRDYLVTQRDNRTRRREYERVSHHVFTARESGQACKVEDLFLRLGGGSRERLTLREVRVSGSPKAGFTVTLTPEPASPFAVVADYE